MLAMKGEMNMAKKNYYAFQGYPTIWGSWPAAQEGMKKMTSKERSGGYIQGFATREEAEEFADIKDHAEEVKKEESEHKEGHWYIYTDGSFDEETNTYAWAYVATLDGKEVSKDYGIGRNKYAAESRNVAGECAAAMNAAKWVSDRNGTATIVHDYEGVGKWAQGEWKTNTYVSQSYVAYMKKYSDIISFRKVKGHNGDKFNEEADRLARLAILESK